MSAESKGVCIIVGMDSQLWGGLLHEPMSHEFWGLNQGHVLIQPLLLKRFTRWFQIHPWGPMVARQRPDGSFVVDFTCRMAFVLGSRDVEVSFTLRNANIQRPRHLQLESIDLVVDGALRITWSHHGKS